MKRIESFKIHYFVMIAVFALTITKLNAQVRDTLLSNQFLDEGIQKMDSKNYEAAIESFTKAIQYNDVNYKAFERRGVCRMKVEDEKPKKGDREYTFAISDFTTALMTVEDVIKECKDYSVKKNLRKDKAPIYINRAWAKIQVDKKKFYKLAIDDFNEAFKHDNTLIEIYIGRAYAYHKMKDFQKEINDYRLILREAEDPNSLSREKVDLQIIYYNMGNAYLDFNNDRKNACEAYKKALNLGYSEAQERVQSACDL